MTVSYKIEVNIDDEQTFLRTLESIQTIEGTKPRITINSDTPDCTHPNSYVVIHDFIKNQPDRFATNIQIQAVLEANGYKETTDRMVGHMKKAGCIFPTERNGVKGWFVKPILTELDIERIRAVFNTDT